MSNQVNSSQSISITELFKKAEMSAIDKKRVKTSNLTSLLKKVENFPGKVSFNSFNDIEKSVNSLKHLLKAQHSNIYQKKLSLIKLSLTHVCNKLSNDAIQALRQEKQAMIANSLYHIRYMIVPKLEKTVTQYTSAVYKGIDALPELEMKNEATELITRGNYSAFSPNYAITKSLFSKEYIEVENRDGYVKTREVDNKHLSKWTSIGDNLKGLQHATNLLDKANWFLSKGNVLLSVEPNKFGQLKFTSDQEQLISLAAKDQK